MAGDKGWPGVLAQGGWTLSKALWTTMHCSVFRKLRLSLWKSKCSMWRGRGEAQREAWAKTEKKMSTA